MSKKKKKKSDDTPVTEMNTVYTNEIPTRTTRTTLRTKSFKTKGRRCFHLRPVLLNYFTLCIPLRSAVRIQPTVQFFAQTAKSGQLSHFS